MGCMCVGGGGVRVPQLSLVPLLEGHMDRLFF